MAVKIYSENNWEEVRSGVFRKIVYLKDIMTVMIEFYNGPWSKAEPFHSHLHEQTCYVAKGKIVLYCEGEADRQLGKGDLFYIPSGKNHAIKVVSHRVRLVDSFSPIREDFL